VAVPAPPSEDDLQGWELTVSPRTDLEGWHYGSVFKCAARPSPAHAAYRTALWPGCKCAACKCAAGVPLTAPLHATSLSRLLSQASVVLCCGEQVPVAPGCC